MKKYKIILGITLFISVLTSSCTKEVQVLEPKLTGLYNYKSAIVPIAVDLDGNGVFNTDLTKESGEECVYDNFWEWKDNNEVVLAEGGVACGTSPAMAVAPYVYDPKNKTITIKNSEGTGHLLTNVKLGYGDNYKQTLSFTHFENKYNQNVTYYFEQVK
jgi:hypothetical protein